MKNLIGNKWCDSSDLSVINITNPANNNLIDTVPNATVEDVNNAVKEAVIAQKSWAKVPLHERGKILLKFASLVNEKSNELASLLSSETGKPITEAIAEMKNVQISVPSFVEKAKHEYGSLIPAGTEIGQEKTIQLVTTEPLGVVAAIIPFNFPIDLFGQKVPPALLMGNSIIVKPSTYNPLTIHKLVELLIEAGIPYVVVQVLSGDGKTTGQALAANSGVNLVSLTGSTEAGIQTMATASKNLTKVVLELGGNDAFILCDDGDVDLAVSETIWGRLYNAGQVCCASKRFLIHNSVKKEYIDKLIQKIKTIKIGDPSDFSTNMGCLINENAALRVEDQIKQNVALGAKVIYGGRRNGAYMEPTILVDVTKDMPVSKDMEIFGPVISIIGFDDLEEAIKVANQSNYGLCGNVITRNMETAFKVSNELEVGGAVINGASFYRSFEMPFGGWKHSGIGNEGVSSSLKEVCRTKTIVLKNIFK